MKEEVLKQAVSCDYVGAYVALEFIQPLFVLAVVGFIAFKILDKYTLGD